MPLFPCLPATAQAAAHRYQPGRARVTLNCAPGTLACRAHGINPLTNRNPAHTPREFSGFYPVKRCPEPAPQQASHPRGSTEIWGGTQGVSAPLIMRITGRKGRLWSRKNEYGMTRL